MSNTTHYGPWPRAAWDSLKRLHERARYVEDGAPLPANGMANLGDFIGCVTGKTQAAILAELDTQSIYKRVTADVPRILTVPGDSPFTPLRRVYVIASAMALPRYTRRNISGRKTLSPKPGKKRKAELDAIRRLLNLTDSTEVRRVLAKREEELRRPSRIVWSRIAHPTLWLLALELLTKANTADAGLLFQAAPLIAPGCTDESTARRYIEQAQGVIGARSIRCPRGGHNPPFGKRAAAYTRR